MGSTPSQSEGTYLPFTYLHALFLACSIITYLVDLTIDVILAATYLSDGYYWYALITVCLVVLPTTLVQVFSVRWHYMDEVMNKGILILHTCLLGVLYRYLVVITNGLEAMKTGENIDYERFYQQQSDVCMLRLFDSFLESAPQLVFHLYIMFVKSHWPTHQVIWTGISAITSMVSLGWGIAAYSSSQRMVRSEKGKMTWTGMILQTVWRFGMLSARIISVVMLTVALNEWSLVVLFVHWLMMTIWVILQDTDFCTNVWEERLYNAIVGVIYCFCFFNLKEGQSRFRATAFYLVIVVENYVFVATFCYMSDFETHPLREGYCIAAWVIVSFGTMVGLTAMLLYYRYFHPVGPIRPPCGEGPPPAELDVEKSPSEFRNSSSSGPDFTIDESLHYPKHDAEASMTTPPSRPARKTRIQYSRSFKDACPPVKRFTPKVTATRGPAPGPESPESPTNTTDGVLHPERMDSAYGTDSNRTASRSTASPLGDSPGHAPVEVREPESEANNSNESGAFNNETYMSVDSPSPGQIRTSKSGLINTVYQSVKRQRRRSSSNSMGCELSQCSQTSADSRITVIERQAAAAAVAVARAGSSAFSAQGEESAEHPEKPLKRSPVVKDVTADPSVADASAAKLTGPLTIIIPNISHQAFARSSHALSDNLSDKTIPLDVVNPALSTPQRNAPLPFHDYENLALININRAPLVGGISHWRTYSDMANDQHDDSTAYEKKKMLHSDYSNFGSLQYYDIHPLSTQLKEQLYRSLTPLSTAATMASDSSNNVSDSDTYEPIEAAEGYLTSNSFQPNKFKQLAENNSVTLIHHDGQKVSTQQILSMENLKEVLKNHQNIPMDDPQDRGDLYLLAPMRILSPILEESEAGGDYSSRMSNQAPSEIYQSLDLNRSIMTVLSEVLSTKSSSYHPRLVEQQLLEQRPAPPSNPDNETTSSTLVHTIEEIRNNSLCNLFFSSFNDTPTKVSPGDNTAPVQPNCPENNNGAAPQVPPRNNASTHSMKATTTPIVQTASTVPILSVEPQRSKNYFVPIQQEPSGPVYKAAGSLKSIHSNTLVPSPINKPQAIKASPLTSTSAGSRKNILELAAGTATHSILNTPNKKSTGHTKFSASLHPPSRDSSVLSMSLSPSSKYETPTPPLRPNQFVRNISNNSRPRRKFSIIREQYESSPKADLYENVSDDLLHNDLSQISQRSQSTPSFAAAAAIEDSEIKADEKYENLQRGWATSSTRQPGTSTRDWCLRNNHNRRSLSGLEENKENCTPARSRKYPSPGPSLSPNAKIFASKR